MNPRITLLPILVDSDRCSQHRVKLQPLVLFVLLHRVEQLLRLVGAHLLGALGFRLRLPVLSALVLRWLLPLVLWRLLLLLLVVLLLSYNFV